MLELHRGLDVFAVVFGVVGCCMIAAEPKPMHKERWNMLAGNDI